MVEVEPIAQEPDKPDAGNAEHAIELAERRIANVLAMRDLRARLRATTWAGFARSTGLPKKRVYALRDGQDPTTGEVEIIRRALDRVERQA